MQYLAELYTYDVSNREPEKHIRERRRSGCGGQLAKSTLPTVTASAATVPTTAIAATAEGVATVRIRAIASDVADLTAVRPLVSQAKWNNDIELPCSTPATRPGRHR